VKGVDFVYTGLQTFSSIQKPFVDNSNKSIHTIMREVFSTFLI